MLILVPYRGFWNSPALSLLEEGEKFFLLLFNYIISNFFYIVKQMREPRLGFQRNPVAYWPGTGQRAPGGVSPPGRYAVGKFSLFGKILPRLAGPQGPIFVSNGPGFREDGPPRPRAARFQAKKGAYSTFSRLCEPLGPKILQKLRNCYKNLIFFNKNLIFDMCFLVKIQPFLTKMMENYGKFTKFTLDKAFIL